MSVRSEKHVESTHQENKCRKKDTFFRKVREKAWIQIFLYIQYFHTFYFKHSYEKINILFEDPWNSLFFGIALKKKYEEAKTQFETIPKSLRPNLIKKWKKDISENIGNDYLGKFPNFDPNNLDHLHEIEKIFRCRIHLWAKRTRLGKYECIRASPFLANYDFHADIILRDFADIEISLDNCGVILDIDKTLPVNIRKKRCKWTIFEALAIQKNPELETQIYALREKVRIFETEWKNETFHVDDAREFYEKFHANVQIWNKKSRRDRTVVCKKVFDRRGMPKLIGRF